MKHDLLDTIYREELYDGDRVQKSLVLVHPGFYLADGQQFPDDISLRDYAEYDREISRLLEEQEEDTETYVLTAGSKIEQSSAFLDLEAHDLEDIKFLESSGRTGRPRPGSLEQYAEIFTGLKDGSTLEIVGEYEGLCRTNVENLAFSVIDEYHHDVDVISGGHFPEEELERTAGMLHWKGEKTEYLRTLERRTKI